jgi:hypothetical protein
MKYKASMRLPLNLSCLVDAVKQWKDWRKSIINSSWKQSASSLPFKQPKKIGYTLQVRAADHSKIKPSFFFFFLIGKQRSL